MHLCPPRPAPWPGWPGGARVAQLCAGLRAGHCWTRVIRGSARLHNLQEAPDREARGAAPGATGPGRESVLLLAEPRRPAGKEPLESAAGRSGPAAIPQRVCARTRLTPSRSAQDPPARPRLSRSGRSAGRPRTQPASSPFPSPFPSPAEMSAQAEAGFVKEASRQIVAGGSAGKAAHRGRVAFDLCVSPNVSQVPKFRLQTGLQVSPSSPPSALPPPPEPAEREQRRPGAGGCPGVKSPGRSRGRWGFPASLVPG